MTERKAWNGKTGTVVCFSRCKIKYNELIKCLDEEHYVENDASRTHSGTERFWIFEIAEGTALAFQYHDLTEELYVGSNQKLEQHQDIVSQFIPVSLEEEIGEMWW